MTSEPENNEQPAEPAALPAAEAAAEAQPVRTVDLRRPAWLTRTVAVAGGFAAATFVVGGAAGYALGHSTGDDGRGRPDRFSRDGSFPGGPGFGPGGQQGSQPGQGQQQGAPDQGGTTS